MTSTRLLKNGSEAFPAMFDAIDRADWRIAMEMYIFEDDETGREFRSHLMMAAKRGVEVMVLVDAFGCWFLPDSFWDELRAAGGAVRWFRPIGRGLLVFRNHRKLLLIDDRVAFVGGFNVANEYYYGVEGEPPWRDNALVFSSHSAAHLRYSFLKMWARADRPLRRLLFRRSHGKTERGFISDRVQFLESGPEDPRQPVRRAYRLVIRNAQERIDLAMSYFYPPGRIMRALRRAVRRGVQVRLLFSQKNDVPIAQWAARGLYGRLLRAGMEVWEYRPSMLHAKLAIADNTVIVGSANMDVRSERINYELVAVVHDPELAAQAMADFEDDLQNADQVLLDRWKQRPFMQQIKERISYWLLARADLYLAKLDVSIFNLRRLRRLR